MNLNYDDFLEKINKKAGFELHFCIKNYAHYKNCCIKRVVDCPAPHNTSLQIERIEITLTDDAFEKLSFYEKFKEEYKLFKFGKRGSFTLKQLWNQVEIKKIIEK